MKGNMLQCLKPYIELLIKEGLQTGISCPDSACPKQGQLLENEIKSLVAVDVMQRYKRLQFERGKLFCTQSFTIKQLTGGITAGRSSNTGSVMPQNLPMLFTACHAEVLLNPCWTWCPSSSCQAVCQLQEAELPMPQLVQCPFCSLRFCSACHADWHTGQTCQGSLPIVTSHPVKNNINSRSKEDEASIKHCPRCSIFIERDQGCAQMLCKNCKHAFCWYCLESLDDDFLLIHYDKGSCQNKLGHSREAVIWHRTQVCSVGRLWPSGSLAGVDGTVGQGQGSCAGSRLSLQSASACPGSPTGSWHHAAGISPNYNYQLQLQMETSRRTSRCILHGLQPPTHSTPQKA
ncbi:hypothetical protein QTP70_023666 [Hemibagrus guttatus]|uniref:E3 ubiquitin-protein ligase RNF144B n=1 Tax=Hemibagrus guttatus TaxID=175788 RepID=A0AAE0Q9B1_9TELE|nr:hypothetical protein QTP70_023666 [Hemibagrus guttatus]